MTVAKYEKEFNRLSKYALEPILTETFRCRLFEDDLKESIKRYLTAVTSLHVVNFYQLVQAAMKIEKSSTCRRITKGCFRCGSIDHLIVNCPRGSGTSRNPQGSSRK